MSPLAKYPGPFLAKISSWPFFYHSLKRDRHIWIWQYFQIYGKLSKNFLGKYLLPSNSGGEKAKRLKRSIFWVEPTLVLFNTPRAYRDIYNYKANVKKNKTYGAWKRHEGDANTLNTTDVTIYAWKKKLLNIVFTENSVRSAAAFIIKHLGQWNELSINGHDWSEPINLSKWTDCLVFDILGDICFGKSFGIKEPGENLFKVILEAIILFIKFWYPVQQFSVPKSYFVDRPLS